MSGATHDTTRNKKATPPQTEAPLSAGQEQAAPEISSGLQTFGMLDHRATVARQQVLQLQRTLGNAATQRLIQRSHGRGCGCAACGSVSAEPEGGIQRKAADNATHGGGCRCPSCSGVQRTPTETAPQKRLKIQRLMSVESFKKQTKALGARKLIKPIDSALAAYINNMGSLSTEQKINALQNIVTLCNNYLDNAKRKKSKRRSGVETLKQDAIQEISTLSSSSDTETPNMSIDTSTEETNMSMETPTEETNMSLVDTPTEETDTPVNTPTEETNMSMEEPNMSIETPTEETNMSIEPPDPELDAAKAYLTRLTQGVDIFSVPAEGDVAPKSRKDILDLLEAKLSDEEFTQAASLMILNVPGSVVEGDKAKAVALNHMKVLFMNKTVARNLLNKETYVVVVPKNKKMTDLPMFSSLAGKKTFDGREWEKVRGSGGMEINGKIYVAVTEENTLGTDAEGDVSGTDWCYASGYSTTTHEIAHVIDIHGLTPEDRKTVDDLYQAKKTRQANGEVVEWIDGFDYNKPGEPKAQAQTLYDAWASDLPGLLNTAGQTDVAQQNNTIAWAKYIIVDGGAVAANNYVAWLKAIGVLSNAGDKVNKRNGALLGNINPTTKKLVFGGSQTTYASSHRLEYFAQTANAYFGTNTGNEPYVTNLWTDAGEPDKGKRRNGKGEVARIEPELNTLFVKLFGTNDIADANPRDRLKREKEAAALGGGGG